MGNLCNKKNKDGINRDTINIHDFGPNDKRISQLRVFKLVLIGSSGVGKSVFFHNFFGTMDKFKNMSTEANGDNDCKRVDVPGRGEATVTIWDTAGQEQYAVITNIFYTDSKGVFIVFDVTNKESFAKIESYWIDRIQDNLNLNDIVVCIIANKIDKEGRVVSQEEGEYIARKHGFIYRETSALNNEGIQEAVQSITEQIMIKSS